MLKTLKALPLKQIGTALLFAIPLTIFMITTFFREPLDNLWGIQHGNQIFFISVICTVIGFLIVAWRCEDKTPNEFISYIEPPADKNTTSVKARLKNGETVKLPCIAYSESLDKISPFFMDPIENPYGGILCVYSKHHEYLTLETASYISPMSWNSLAIKLFMRDTHSEAFTQIYPIDENTKPHIKIWEIHYPPDIKTNPKYLKTGFPEIDKDLLPQ